MDTGGKRIDLELLEAELASAGITVNGLGQTEDEVYTYDEAGVPVDLPPAAQPVVDAHTAPPLLVDYAGTTEVDAIVRTTDDQAVEVFRFACEQRRLYRADLTIMGVDAGNFVSRTQEGRFVWKRTTGNAVMVGIQVVANLGEAASASWAPNAVAAGTEVIFTVKGAPGRTVDWCLGGKVLRYAPGGLEA